MAHPQYRANGWDPPVTNTQVFAFSGYIVSTALYIGIVASSGMAATGAAIGVVAALSVVVIAIVGVGPINGCARHQHRLMSKPIHAATDPMHYCISHTRP